jgi:hypothetical protein
MVEPDRAFCALGLILLWQEEGLLVSLPSAARARGSSGSAPARVDEGVSAGGLIATLPRRAVRYSAWSKERSPIPDFVDVVADARGSLELPGPASPTLVTAVHPGEVDVALLLELRPR